MESQEALEETLEKWLETLTKAVQTIGKPAWRPMLQYVAELHIKSIHPPRYPFAYPWEEIGPGYCYSPAFGHIDIIHAVLDTLPHLPEHARNQILNDLVAQEDDGLVPGVIWMQDDPATWKTKSGHPPVWPVAVQAYTAATGSDDLIEECYDNLIRQIAWFEKFRRVEPIGFYYTDILTRIWESGVDEGVRFDGVFTEPQACVDASALVYSLYDYADIWARRLGKDPEGWRQKALELADFIQTDLFLDETGFFHDSWAVNDPAKRRLVYVGMWPLVVGAATHEQAMQVIDQNLLNPDRFLSEHPITTVGMNEPRFELRMWRGPAWNSITYWATRGCVRYGRPDAARTLLEKALDASARQFERSGTVWEFYHPHGGDPEALQRKPETDYNTPSREYLGHNPVIAMARLYDKVKEVRASENKE